MADTSTFTAVDLSRLPAPAIVEALDFETIYQQLLSLVRTGVAGLFDGIADFDATVESDPAVKVLQVAAYQVLLLRARVNDAARAVMVAYAAGADLDQIGANFGVERLVVTAADEDAGTAAVMEGDDALRRRILLAPEGYSVAGPEGAYIFHALSADGQVLDASAISPDDQPGTVYVTVLARTADGVAPPALLATVAAYLGAEDRRPLTDELIVRSAAMTNFAIDARITMFAGPDSGVVLAQARTQLDAYLAESLRLGRDITRFGISSAIATAGIQNVNLVSPAADIILDRSQAGHCTGIALTFTGTGE